MRVSVSCSQDRNKWDQDMIRFREHQDQWHQDIFILDHDENKTL